MEITIALYFIIGILFSISWRCNSSSSSSTHELNEILRELEHTRVANTARLDKILMELRKKNRIDNESVRDVKK